jgi:hypothetical protein
MAINRPASQNERSEQYMENASYDTDFDVLTREILGYDSVGDNLVRFKVDADGRLVAAFDDFEGGDVSVGTSPVEITFTGTTRIISIQADVDNTGNVFVGKSNAQSDGTNAMAKLAAGQSIEVTLDDSTNSLYVVSDTTDQKVFKMALIA